MIVRVSADGTVDEQPVVEGLAQPMGITLAPDGFGHTADRYLSRTLRISKPLFL